jgi:RNA polymerase sigma factor (sigma-70 family)
MMTDPARRALLFHFCRMQLPAVALATAAFERHLDRTFAVFRRKTPEATVPAYLDSLYSLDWYLACACMEGDGSAWEQLFAARTGRSDCLLVDALRARAARLYPRDDERQETAVAEFWSQLLVSESGSGLPVLARYDGQRPLVPWLIRVFQNAHISRLRAAGGTHALPDDDIALPLPNRADGRWHEAFCQAAREALATLSDSELLILGMRLRYRMSQREVAHLLGVHEGTISRQTDKLRDHCMDQIRDRLLAQGWTGDDLGEFVLTEMGPLLLDEPRLGADRLAALLAARGRSMPDLNSGSSAV